MDWTAILISAGIPSGVAGLCFLVLELRIKRREKRREQVEEIREKERKEREHAREKNELYIMKGMGAAIALGEATARAVQRIPDAKCNGDMTKALEYATRVKHEQKDFLNEQAMKYLYSEGEGYDN